MKSVLRCVCAVVAISLLATPAYAASNQSNGTPAQSAPALTAQDLSPFLDALVPYAIDRAGIAGAVIVVVKDGKIVVTKGYGYRDIAKREPVIADQTMFRPGSVSKLFTWTSVMQLVQAGKINLDADVNTYLDFKIPEKFGKPITMRNLMTHTAGFEETLKDLLVDKESQLYPIRDYLIQRMPGRIFPPGEVIAYSNYGATLAGYIVQRVSGEPFDDYVAKHIYGPLHMEHSTFQQPLPARFVPFMANGYIDTSSDKPTPFEFVEAAPAGSSTTTAPDMARFMMAFLGGGTYDGGTILKPRTVREMWTEQLTPAQGMNGFDLGFYQENRNGIEIVGHAGDTNVFHSDLHLLPAQHVGVFMSFNSAGKEGAAEGVRTQVFRAFLDRYYPYNPADPKTVADPQSDAKRVAGWYISSRRSERALRLVFAFTQASVDANADGTITVSELKDPAQNPMRLREIGPLYYQQIDGQTHVKFVADSNGAIQSWTTDEMGPVMIFQRVNGMRTLGALKVMIPAFCIVLFASLVLGLAAWIKRRKGSTELVLSPAERWLRIAARIGAALFLGTLIAWTMSISNMDALLQSSFAGTLYTLYAFGVVAIIGGVAIVLNAIMRVARADGGWVARIGAILVGLAGCYGIWLFTTYGLANFVTNF